MFPVHLNDFGLSSRSIAAENQYVNKLTSRGRKPAKGPSPFSKNLKVLMAEKALSSREVARICGVAPSLVSQWLSGANPSDSLAILRLCDATGANFQFLMTGVTPKSGGMERLQEIFITEDEPSLSGIFLIEAKKLRWRK